MPPQRSPEENLEKEEKKTLTEPLLVREVPSEVEDRQEVAPAKFEEAPTAGAKLAAAVLLQQAEMDANETTSSNHSDAGVVVANKPSHLTENVSSEECDSVELQTPSGTIATATTAEHIQDGLPSIGSAGHFAGECKRCCFHPKGRCSNGYDCRFCHFDHDKRKRTKKPMTPTGPGDMQSMQPNMGPMGMMPQAQASPCFMPPCMGAPLATVPADMTHMDPMQAHMRGPDEAAMAWGNEMQMQMPMPGMPGMAPWQQAPPMFPPVNHQPPFGFNPPMWPQPCGPGPCVPPMMEGPGLVLPRYTSNAGCLMPEAPLGTIPVNSAPVLTMPNQMPPNPIPPHNLLAGPPAGPMPCAPMPLPEPLPPGAVQAGPMPAQGPVGAQPTGAPVTQPGTQPTGPQATPLATSPEGKGPNPPEKKGNDSPRSVILKLTGAWNALATGKGHDLPEPGADFEDMRAMCVPPAR